MYRISKKFPFCFGHRIWAQNLTDHASLNGGLDNKCRQLHGHNSEVEVTIAGQELNAVNQMLLDFNNLGFFKKWIDETIDHRFLIDINDPLLTALFPDFSETRSLERKGAFRTLKVPANAAPVWKEFLESFVVISFLPTSERMAENLFHVINETLRPVLEGTGAYLESVTMFETEKAKATFQL